MTLAAFHPSCPTSDLMNLLHWHRVFDECTDLDAIHGCWQAAAQEYYLNPSHETPEYHDALLSFIVNAPQPAPLRLAALLTCVSGFDFDLRLALGALDDPETETSTEWPAVFAGAASLLGPCPAFAVRDPALAHFALGRLTALRDMLRWQREDHAQWRQAFWNAYLDLACRWADGHAFSLALAQGARPDDRMPQMLEVLAEGVHSPAFDTPYYTAGRGNADYLALVDRLRESGLDLRQESATVLAAAARVGNTDMLAQLVTRGADLAMGGRAALKAAAAVAAHDAAEWLVVHGVNGAADLDSALLDAVATLDETMTELLLDAGADLHIGDGSALRIACAAHPFDLYNGETRFISQRADMLVLLARRGADLRDPRFHDALRRAGHGTALLLELLGRPELDVAQRQAIASA